MVLFLILDLGGPRREFLRVNMRYVQDLLFQENAGGCSLKEDTTLSHTSNKHYYVTGLLMGRYDVPTMAAFIGGGNCAIRTRLQHCMNVKPVNSLVHKSYYLYCTC